MLTDGPASPESTTGHDKGGALHSDVIEICGTTDYRNGTHFGPVSGFERRRRAPLHFEGRAVNALHSASVLVHRAPFHEITLQAFAGLRR
jgi:hypothetical protein